MSIESIRVMKPYSKGVLLLVLVVGLCVAYAFGRWIHMVPADPHRVTWYPIGYDVRYNNFGRFRGYQSRVILATGRSRFSVVEIQGGSIGETAVFTADLDKYCPVSINPCYNEREGTSYLEFNRHDIGYDGSSNQEYGIYAIKPSYSAILLQESGGGDLSEARASEINRVFCLIVEDGAEWPSRLDVMDIESVIGYTKSNPGVIVLAFRIKLGDHDE